MYLTSLFLDSLKGGRPALLMRSLEQKYYLTAVVPLTSIATILKYGETLNIKVYFNDGRVSEIEPATLTQ